MVLNFMSLTYQAFALHDWQVNFNAAAIASANSISDQSLKICGSFRAYNDYIGFIWKNTDTKNHAMFRHEKVTDFADIIIDFDVSFTGAVKPFDAAIEDKAPALAVYYSDGTILTHLLRDSMTGSNHYHIDFSHLFERRMVENPDYDPSDPESQPYVLQLFPLPTTGIETVVMAIVPTYYDYTNVTCTGRFDEFTVLLSNYTVTGGYTTIDDYERETHFFRVAEGYDDECFRNPRNLLMFNRKLGYRDVINLYIGASHYYEKVGIAGADSEDYNNFKVVESKGLCLAFSEWLKCLCYYMPQYGFNRLIVSISMENLHIPEKWQQLFYDKESACYKAGRTGWEPPTFFFSPTNQEARIYYQRICEESLDIAISYLGSQNVTLQLGEPWWWWQEFMPGDVSIPYPNRPPCFYDQATVALHLSELGREIPVFDTSSFELTSKNIETANWLGMKLGDFSDFVRRIAKDKNVKYTILFFPPSVLDSKRVPKGMMYANFARQYWKFPNLDFIQIEDYDWLMTENKSHLSVFKFALKQLNYQFVKANYFAGFAWAEYQEPIEVKPYKKETTISMVPGGVSISATNEAAYFNVVSDQSIYNELQIRSETFSSGDVIYIKNSGTAYLAISAVNSTWGFTYLSGGMNMAPYQPYIMKCVYNGWGADTMWSTYLVSDYGSDGSVAAKVIDPEDNNDKSRSAYEGQWKKIERAANKGITLGFSDVFIWAGTQIRRDGYSLRKFMVPEIVDDIDIRFINKK